jgi:predicted component of type VI protein secretion system
MYGHLVPASGGKSIALLRERIYLGRRADSDPDVPLNSQTAACRLRFDHGWWHAEELATGAKLRVNGKDCSSQRIRPTDEVAVGRNRFRIEYHVPADSRHEIDAIAEEVLSSIDAPTVPKRLTPRPPPHLALPAVTVQPAPRAAPNYDYGLPDHRRPDTLGRLVPVGGGVDYALTQPSIVVGRNPTCDLVIPSSKVSGTHCRLEWIDGYWRVQDLGSRNGVRVDGVKCEQAWVHPNMRLVIGDHRFEIDYTPQGEPPEPSLQDPAYRKPLMEKVGSQRAWDELLTRHESMEQDEPQKKRYDLLNDL